MTGAASTRAVALLGLTGTVVEIEAALLNETPKFVLVGLPDAALREAQQRVRSAIEHSGLEMPRRQVTVGLSPAALPKQGSAFDLGVAIAILATERVVPADAVASVVHIGELALDGRLRPAAGVLPAVLAARDAGCGVVVVPTGNVQEASLVPGIRVVGLPSLREVAIFHGAELEPEPVEPILAAGVPLPSPSTVDLADVVGNTAAVQALVVAAAGGHHMLMVGPPGAGKTMLATRLPGILPDLDERRALEASCVASLAGARVGELVVRPPWQAPHHSATAAAIVGGGSRLIRPGAAARASGGILFLDEAPEFKPNALDALRQPLESGEITVERAAATAVFPGRFQLVLAANPCPCGQYGAADAACSCPPAARRRYLARLSGPLLDRIDIRLRLERVSAAHLRLASERGGVSTSSARERVAAARDRARQRLAATPWRTNAEVPGPWLRSGDRRLEATVCAPLDAALERGLITMRGYDRVLRMAWTIADLDGVDRPGRAEIGRALLLRSAA